MIRHSRHAQRRICHTTRSHGKSLTWGHAPDHYVTDVTRVPEGSHSTPREGGDWNMCHNGHHLSRGTSRG
jgi:hypothetical protein